MCDSRRAFKIRRKDNFENHYTVKGLSKKRKLFKAYRGLEDKVPDTDFEDLEQSFWATVSKAKDSLDG